MPIIQDPRMNPGNEKDYGIFYLSDKEVANVNKENNISLEPGHHFYVKESNPNDFKNSRFFPHGFPITRIVVTGQDISQALYDEYAVIYCRLHKKICKVEYDGNITDIDNNFPMAALLHRVIYEDTPTKRGLKRITTQGNPYFYNRGNGDLGVLD